MYKLIFPNNSSPTGTTLKLDLIKQLYDCDTKINHIFISNELNVCAVASTEGLVYLYTFPDFKLFRVILHDDIKSTDNVRDI